MIYLRRAWIGKVAFSNAVSNRKFPRLRYGEGGFILYCFLFTQHHHADDADHRQSKPENQVCAVAGFRDGRAILQGEGQRHRRAHIVAALIAVALFGECPQGIGTGFKVFRQGDFQRTAFAAVGAAQCAVRKDIVVIQQEGADIFIAADYRAGLIDNQLPVIGIDNRIGRGREFAGAIHQSQLPCGNAFSFLDGEKPDCAFLAALSGGDKSGDFRIDIHCGAERKAEAWHFRRITKVAVLVDKHLSTPPYSVGPEIPGIIQAAAADVFKVFIIFLSGHQKYLFIFHSMIRYIVKNIIQLDTVNGARYRGLNDVLLHGIKGFKQTCAFIPQAAGGIARKG